MGDIVTQASERQDDLHDTLPNLQKRLSEQASITITSAKWLEASVRINGRITHPYIAREEFSYAMALANGDDRVWLPFQVVGRSSLFTVRWMAHLPKNVFSQCGEGMWRFVLVKRMNGKESLDVFTSQWPEGFAEVFGEREFKVSGKTIVSISSEDGAFGFSCVEN